MTFSRRKFLAGIASAPLGVAALSAQPTPRRPRIAAVYTVCNHRSHAHVILENFLRPYLFNGRMTEPTADIVSIYTDQRHPREDMTEDIARQFRIPVFRTVDGAMTLDRRELAVDGVLLIGEHGNYPTNRLGQVEYPRKRLFDAAVAAMQAHQRFVPIFNDKHLSYRWDWAQEMYATCQRHRIPFMAGSSVPLAHQRPNVAPANAPVMEEIVSIHGGPFESYDFHGLEVLQSLAEARRGGETGIASVEFLDRAGLQRAADAGRFSLRLVESALAREFDGQLPNPLEPLSRIEPHGILLAFRDGLRGLVLKVGASGTRWLAAYRLRGDPTPHATKFYVGPWNNRCLFMALSNAIQHFFRTGTAPYAVERTVLTTGALEAACRSRAEQRRLDTPNLNMAYRPTDFAALREMGASWNRLTEDDAQTRGIVPLPLRPGR
jgi:hypothetical protein